MRSDKTNHPARIAMITGAANGLGFHTAISLARSGFDVILVDHNQEAGLEAVRRIRISVPAAVASFHAVDLARIEDVQAFGEQMERNSLSLSILVNNAGLLPPIARQGTIHGHELGFGVSVVGHYVLTGALLHALHRSEHPRVVTLSSIAHKKALLPLDDLRMQRSYDPTRAYGATKLAALTMAMELQRRATSASSPLISVAAHPGISRTSIGSGWNQAKQVRLRDRIAREAMNFAMRYLGQSPEQGAMPTVMAATMSLQQGGILFGPNGIAELRGSPKIVQPAARALDEVSAGVLWNWLENETGMRYVWPC